MSTPTEPGHLLEPHPRSSTSPGPVGRRSNCSEVGEPIDERGHGHRKIACRLAGPAERSSATRGAEAVPRELECESGHKAWVVTRVAGPEAPRLLREPVDPLHPVILHPGRGLGDQPSVEVEGGADADEDRGLEPRAHLRHPQLLLWLADAHPDDVG